MKRQIAFVAALVMLVTTVFSGSVFAADSFSDVAEDNRYRTAIITLSKLGVIDGYDDGTFKPEGEITRAEFTKMLISALGYGSNTAVPTEFDDTNGHWAASFIKTAYDLGIVNGTGERTFEPENPVTYEQAMKMLVCTLGYEGTAIANGGYPNGYLTAGASIDLDENISGQGNSDPARRQVVAQLVYNALEVPFMTRDITGTWSESDETLLEDHLGVIKVQGMLTGVEDSTTNDCDVKLNMKQISVRPTSGSDRRTVVINIGDYEEYSAGELAKMLGNEMTFFYSQGLGDDDRQLRIIDNETTKNESTTVSYKNFLRFNGTSFEYADGASRKTLKMGDDLTVIYNGQAVTKDNLPLDIASRYEDNAKETASSISELLSLWLGGDTAYNIRGEATFTDSGADGTTDIITINNYQTIVAYKAPTTSDYRLQDSLKTGVSENLDPNDVNKKIYIEKDGREIEPTGIRAKDVVSYTKSLDGSVLNLYVVSEKVTGTVNSIDMTNQTITIGNTEYDLGEDCIDYIQEKEGRTLTSGVSGTFYLDKLNTVVYGTLQEAEEEPYGYIGTVNEDYNEGVLYITAYIPSKSTSSAAIYSLADNARINGKTISDYSEAMTILASHSEFANPDVYADDLYLTGAPEHTEYSQPARIEVSGNEITSIYTIDEESSSQNEDPTKLVRYKELYNYYYTGSSFKKSSSGSVDFSVNSSTTVLYVPRDRSARSEYSRKTVSNAFTSGDYYWVEAYDVNQSNVASLVILYGENAQLNEVKSTTPFSIVSDFSEEYDPDEDMTTTALEVYEGASTSTKSWAAASDDIVADVEIGDVIQFDYDDNNKIQNVYTRIKYSDIENVLSNDGGVDVSYEDGTERTEIYNWNEAIEPTRENWWQKFMFDFRYPSSKTSDSGDEMYTSTALGKVPISRVCVYNVYQLLGDSDDSINRMYLTKEGFDPETGELRSSDVLQYDEVTVSSSTKVLRMEELPGGMTFSPYAPDTTTELTVRDLKDAAHYGQECSKVIVCTRYGGAQLIVVLPESL